MFGFRRKNVEARDVQRTQSASDFFEAIIGYGSLSESGQPVTVDSALGVPAVWAAVNFLSGTLAGLPIHVYRETRSGRERVRNGVAPILHDAPNDGQSSFEWRKYGFDQVFTGGRWVSFIDRNARGDVVNLWPLDYTNLMVVREGGAKFYDYKDGGRLRRYRADEVVDIPFMLKPDGVGHRSPITANKEAIGLAQAVISYGGRFFNNGGVPPFAVTGNFQSGQSLKRAADDLQEAVKKAAKEQRQALTLPSGLEIKPIGVDAEKSQMLDVQRFSVEQIARIYSLPPTFLQDLSHGTFSNTEQQDLHFVKHTLKRWVEQFEQELNLKLFGRGNRKMFVEVNLDGMLRGDFKARMDGYAQAVQNGILTPNEARGLENRPMNEFGDQLMIQGATVPISNQLTPKSDGGQNGV